MFRLTLSWIVVFCTCRSLGYVNKNNSIFDGDGINVLYWFDNEFEPPKESYWQMGMENASIYSINYNETYDGRDRKAKIPNKLSPRDKSWLASHNARRKKYHSKYKSKYIPLQWSSSLKEEADQWARKLIKKCGGKGLLMHDPNSNYGENLASGYGKELPSADSVLQRWVEKEENDSYPANGHYTQVLWRSTEYVGCADATAPYKRRKLKRGKAGKMNKNGKNNGKAEKDGGGIKCQVQVCRYARPGNCNMSNYDNYKTAMLDDDSPCGPYCPPGGCKSK